MFNWTMAAMPILAWIVVLFCFWRSKGKSTGAEGLMAAYEAFCILSVNLIATVLFCIRLYERNDRIMVTFVLYFVSAIAVSLAVYKRRTVLAVFLFLSLLFMVVVGGEKERKIKKDGKLITWRTEVVRFTTNDICTKGLKLWINGVDCGEFKIEPFLRKGWQYCTVNMKDLKKLPPLDKSSRWFKEINKRNYGSKFCLPYETFKDYSRSPSMTVRELDEKREFYAYFSVGDKVVKKGYYHVEPHNWIFDHRLFNSPDKPGDRTKIVDGFIGYGVDSDRYVDKLVNTARYKVMTGSQFDGAKIQEWNKQVNVLAVCKKISRYELKPVLVELFIARFYEFNELKTVEEVNQFVDSLSAITENYGRLKEIAAKAIYKKLGVNQWLSLLAQSVDFKSELREAYGLNSFRKSFYLLCLKYYYDSELANKGQSEVGRKVLDLYKATHWDYCFPEYFPEDTTTLIIDRYNEKKPPIFEKRHIYGTMTINNIWATIFRLRTERAKKLQRYALHEFLNSYESYCKSYEGNQSTFWNALTNMLRSDMKAGFLPYWPEFRKTLAKYLSDGACFRVQWELLSAMGEKATPEMYFDVFKEIIVESPEKFRYKHMPFGGQKELELRVMIDTYMQHKSLLGFTSSSDLNRFLDYNKRRLQEFIEEPLSIRELLTEIKEIKAFPLPEKFARLEELKKHGNKEVRYRANSALRDLNRLQKRPISDFPMLKEKGDDNE